jgi:hypothetical protein
MITFSILILIVAKALPVLNTKIYSIHVTRITTIVFLFAAALTLNILNLENIIVIIDQSFLKKLVFVYFFLVGGFQLLNLYLVHKFASKIVKLPVVFPDFFINWLKEFEVIVLSEESIKEFKKICYIELVIYLIMMVIFILIFN